MTENYRGRHKQSYNNRNNSNNRGRYRKYGGRNTYNQQRDRAPQYDDIEGKSLIFFVKNKNKEQ